MLTPAHPLSCHIETPTKGRGGCSRTTAPAVANGAARVDHDRELAQQGGNSNAGARWSPIDAEGRHGGQQQQQDPVQ